MKKSLLFALAIPFAFSSCQKEDLLENATEQSTGKQQICTEASTDLIAGQHHLAGNVTVENDDDFIYVTYNATGNWRIKKTHLYIGDCDGIPTNGGGNPKIGLFPLSENHSNPSVGSYTYAISRDNVPACGCVAAHAEVVRLNGGGIIVQSETAWGEGPTIGGKSWAMKFNYCAEDCEEVLS